MAFGKRLNLVVLVSSAMLGCHRASPVTRLDEPTQTVVSSAFTRLKAWDEREVVGVRLWWCPAGVLRENLVPTDFVELSGA